METNPRQEKGKEIAEKQDQIKRIDSTHYQVKSQSSENHYDVISTELGFNCSCPDHIFRKVCCKHIHAVEISLQIRKEVESVTIINQIDTNNCKFCNSTEIIKKGLRKNKTYNLQVFQCKSCNKKFSINLGFERMKASPQVITSAMQLYFTGESLRNVQKFLELQGVKITHKTVWNWIRKFTSLMESYLEKITPQVGDKWRADELYLKVKGNMKYLYALMDDDTRFWLASQVADTKYKEDIQQLFREGREFANKRPKALITDGARNFNEGFRKEFWTRQGQRPKHIRHIHFKGDKNNNKMERLNGEFRDREKVMRGIKTMDSPVFKGYKIFHNYIRTHEGLEGKTPADASGIKIEGNNKWITIIQNASKNDRYRKPTI